MEAATRSHALARIFLVAAFGATLSAAPASAQKPGGTMTVGLELDMSIDAGKVAQTAVVIPAPDSEFEPLDDHKSLKRFPRVLSHDEIPALNAVDCFVFRDLLDRARAIAALDGAERRELVDNGRLDERFPVTFEGLREGYVALGADYEQKGEPRRAARSYFRAIVVAAAHDDTRAIADIAEKVGMLALRMGDRPAALNYLNGAAQAAERVGDQEWAERLRKRMREVEPT